MVRAAATAIHDKENLFVVVDVRGGRDQFFNARDKGKNLNRFQAPIENQLHCRHRRRRRRLDRR